MTLVVTLSVILLAFIGLVVFDIYLGTAIGYHATISYQALQAARHEPIIPLVLGLVLGTILGHIFWPQCGK